MSIASLRYVFLVLPVLWTSPVFAVPQVKTTVKYYDLGGVQPRAIFQSSCAARGRADSRPIRRVTSRGTSGWAVTAKAAA